MKRNKDSKRVLFVISSLNTGGAQRVVSNLTTHFPKEWDIDILLNSAENITYPYRGNIISMNMKEPKDRASLSYQMGVFRKRIIRLRKLKKEGKYAACVSFLTSANVANVLSGKRYCRTVISTHSSLLRSNEFRKYPLLLKVFSRIFNHADCHVAISEGVRYELINKLKCRKDRVCVIYNGFDVDSIKKDSNAQVKKEYGKYDIVTMGRLTPPKNQWHLIRAVKELKKKHSDIQCLIIGDGAYEEYLRRLIHQGHLEENVILYGFVSNPFPLLKQGKIFVLPSGWEGFGNVVIEAMALGLPCVLSDYRYGAREILAPGVNIHDEIKEHIEMYEYGIMTPVCSGRELEIDVPPENEERLLCDAIEIMMTSEIYQRYHKASLKRAGDFDINRIVGQWIQVIEG